MLLLKRQGAVNSLTKSSKLQSLGHRDMAASYLCNHNCKSAFHAQPTPPPPSPPPSDRIAWRIRNRRANLAVKCCSGSEGSRVFENPNAQLVRDLDSELRRSESVKPNGFPARTNGFHSRSLGREKLVVAVDVDEVLGNFVSALNRFIADRYAANHSVSEYHVYEFYKIWKCSRDEADVRVHEFFKTSYFKTGIHPLPGAKEALHKLSGFCNLSVVTSRQNAIKDHTIQWIESHFPGLFQEIHFGNHFALHGESRPKSEICRSLGAKVLIDDNPRYALECAEVGMRVLLFDYENSYPWCKTDSVDLHPLVTRVHNWEAVEKQLMAWNSVRIKTWPVDSKHGSVSRVASEHLEMVNVDKFIISDQEDCPAGGCRLVIDTGILQGSDTTLFNALEAILPLWMQLLSNAAKVWS